MVKAEICPLMVHLRPETSKTPDKKAQHTQQRMGEVENYKPCTRQRKAFNVWRYTFQKVDPPALRQIGRLQRQHPFLSGFWLQQSCHQIQPQQTRWKIGLCNDKFGRSGRAQGSFDTNILNFVPIRITKMSSIFILCNR